VRGLEFTLQLLKRLSDPLEVARGQLDFLFLLVELVLQQHYFSFAGLFLFNLEGQVL